MTLNEKFRQQIADIKSGETPSDRYAMALNDLKAVLECPADWSREEISALFDIARARAAELVRWHLNGRK